MRVRLFTLRYSSTLGGFFDSPIGEFFRDKEILSFREHFFAVNEVPHLACVVTYQEAVLRNAGQGRGLRIEGNGERNGCRVETVRVTQCGEGFG